jgi:hypothetical protein
VVRRTADGSGWECKAVALGEVAGITASTEWPGSTDWSRISNAPAVVTSGSTVAVTGPAGAPVAVAGMVSITGTPLCVFQNADSAYVTVVGYLAP